MVGKKERWLLNRIASAVIGASSIPPPRPNFPLPHTFPCACRQSSPCRPWPSSPSSLPRAMPHMPPLSQYPLHHTQATSPSVRRVTSCARLLTAAYAVPLPPTLQLQRRRLLFACGPCPCFRLRSTLHPPPRRGPLYAHCRYRPCRAPLPQHLQRAPPNLCLNAI